MLAFSDDELPQRRVAMVSQGLGACKPANERHKRLSKALQADARIGDKRVTRRGAGCDRAAALSSSTARSRIIRLPGDGTQCGV